jgi:hypothetical protein
MKTRNKKRKGRKLKNKKSTNEKLRKTHTKKGGEHIDRNTKKIRKWIKK